MNSTGIVISAFDALFGRTFIMAGSGLAAGAFFIETGALSAGKFLQNHKGTLSKITKLSLILMALISAFLLTGGMSFAAAIGISFYSQTDLTAPLLAAVGTTLIALPLHWKAFKWSKLI